MEYTHVYTEGVLVITFYSFFSILIPYKILLIKSWFHQIIQGFNPLVYKACPVLLMVIHFFVFCNLDVSSYLLVIIFFSAAALCGSLFSGEVLYLFQPGPWGHQWPEMSFPGLFLGVSHFEGIIKLNLIFT